MLSRSPSDRFHRARADHSREIAEDYVELIEQLIEERGEARVTDIASAIGVSKVTVSRTIQRLQRDGFVRSEPYRSVFLTELGKELAEKARIRHEIVLSFLRALGVSETAAENDAEGIEHHVSEESLAAMRRFVQQSRKR